MRALSNALWIVCTLQLACAGSSAPSTRAAPRTASPPVEAAAVTESGWSVAWERTLGVVSGEPLFAPDTGAVISGGARFNAQGVFRGFSPAHVPGGRMLADLRALLPGGRALVSTTGSENVSELVLVALGEPPEHASAQVEVYVESLDVDTEAGVVAVHTGSEVELYALPKLDAPERRALPGSVYDRAAVATTPGGGLAYAAPATSCGERCSELALVVESEGRERRPIDGGAREVAFSPAGDAAAVWMDDGEVRVVSLPEAALIGRTEVPRAEAHVLAVADGGDAIAAFSCDRLRVLERRGDGYGEAYGGPLREGSGEGGCSYPSGLRFSPDGDRLALAAGVLTVLERGPARASAPTPRYEPRLPPGFGPTEQEVLPLPAPRGTGLADRPRVVASYEHDGQIWAGVHVVARDAGQLAAAGSLSEWADTLLTRYEPLVRGQTDPNEVDTSDRELLPYRKAFVDASGRRNLEYAIFLRDGCEPHDRYVRYVEDGRDLLEITIVTQTGVDPAIVRPWIERFFDEPFGAGAEGDRVLAKKLARRGGC